MKRWVLPGDPRGLAFGSDGTLYVGLASPQAVAAIDVRSGAITRQVVLDSPDIASTKELVTLRTNRDGTRLYVANGSDESATILNLPGLGIVREITMEGESIRDALPDPAGRHLYLLGRRVHVFDADGRTQLRTLPIEEPMAIAVSSNGSILAVLGAEDFGNATVTMVYLFDGATLTELARDPLQTEERIETATFADRDRALVAFSRTHRFEKSLAAKQVRPLSTEAKSGAMRMSIDFGDLVNSDRICLPEGSGPQVATLTSSDTLQVFAEPRCGDTGGFSGSARRVASTPLYGVNAYAIAWDRRNGTIVATERSGFLTVFQAPK